MTFFRKVPQILVAAIWMCSQIGSSCRMSKYSTGPTAVRKEQRVVKVLLLQTHPGFFFFFFFPGSCKMENRKSAFTLFLSPFLGTLMPAIEEFCKVNAREVTPPFLCLPAVSLKNLSLNLCSNILQRHYRLPAVTTETLHFLFMLGLY